MKQASERGDDEGADRDAERLALACPAYRPQLLSPGRGVPVYRRTSPTQSVTYEIRLGARDRITWAAVYVSGARIGNGDLPESGGQLTANFHVVAGEGAEKGRTFVVSSRLPRGWNPWNVWPRPLTVALARASGEPPFTVRLKTEARDMALNGGEGTPTAPELADRVRPFEPPVELRDAGAPGVVFNVCPKGAGHPQRFYIEPYLGAPQVHPRHLASVLEWLRRLSYASTPYSMCDFWEFDFQTRIDPPHGLLHLLERGLEASGGGSL